MLVVEAPIAHRLGRETLRYNIRPWEQLQDQLARLRFTEIEGDAFLRSVVASEELAVVRPRLAVLPGRRNPQHIEARDRLDSDYIGAIVCEVLGGNGPDSDPREVEQVNSFESITAHRIPRGQII